jgi:ATP-dependent helicase HrpB
MSAPLTSSEHPLTRALAAALSGHRDAVLQAPTGAGKSTIVPLALLTEPFSAGGGVLMLEPRRVAARAVAARMATLCGEPVGATIGYRVRLDSRVSRTTRIEVITEGVLTRLLQEDPALEGTDWVIFDEYHERSLQADLALALALDARRELGASFRILVMSATIEAERVACLLDQAAIVAVPGRAYPVEIHYLGRGLPPLGQASDARSASRSHAPPATAALLRSVQHALADRGGDVLVFLPGVGEIERLAAQLQEAGVPPQVRVLPLHGQLSSEAQDAVLAPAQPGLRKIILATNIAETSLTVPGVTVVIDSGLARRSRFDPRTGMSRLELVRISRAESQQRAGRAGRLAPGSCYRLWGEEAQGQLAATTPAEILEADLAPLALELARWGASDVTRLSWLDCPPAPALAQARELLARLGAIDAVGRVSGIGAQMARMAVHPRLAHMLLAARSGEALTVAARLAALLSERDVLRGTQRDPDIRTRLELLQKEAGRMSGDFVSVLRAAQALEAGARNAAVEAAGGRLDSPDALAVEAALRSAKVTELPGALLALAFPDRIGLRRQGLEGRYLLANGRGAVFRQQVSLAREPLIVAVALDDREREARIDLAAPLTMAVFERLFPAQIERSERCAWDEEHGAVELLELRRYGALTLEERRGAADEQRALPVLLDWLQRRGVEALPWDKEARDLQRRMELARGLGRRDLADWPASDDGALLASLAAWLTPWLAAVTRRDALTRVPLPQALYARLSPEQQRRLERLVPREIVLPAGRRVRIDYLGDQAPAVSVRLQDAFGLNNNPTIADGALVVTMRLLSPARRPMQITRDLAGFWRGGYAEVRKQLRGRYPKHAWPEDPLLAPMTQSSGGVPRRRERR